MLLIGLGQALSNTNAALNSAISIAKLNACNAVSQSSTNVMGSSASQVERALLAEGSGKGDHRLTFDTSFRGETVYLNIQIDEFKQDAADAADLGISMRKAKPTAQEAEDVATVLARLPKSATLSEQKKEISEAETLSLSVTKALGNVMGECRPYL